MVFVLQMLRPAVNEQSFFQQNKFIQQARQLLLPSFPEKERER